ncbi:Ig-like domain-containing protein [Roseimicrobium sp. ORNL1]|uniref:Ig-like domain-containing protein n=1 Tax=Roseimicrobium sp. ORNL1 TaxID=2711231 RepID=UPI0013E17E7A|nr:Ig-like domain-containing protein [Roseimicrobium sp. ORNL1]QIF01017.1 Ig-like domain-containing protein [Roseimicrobium sp. ORNL1]
MKRALLSCALALGWCWPAFAGEPSPAPLPPPPQLSSIHPSGSALPANHLKFYLHFSEPMQQGVFLQHCSVMDADGKVVPEPFRETELWSEDGLRLTLWFHPGRQKTGVNLNVEIGPVLVPGKRCKLIISGAWKSERGVPLGKDVEKSFFVTERTTQQLNIADWKITPPAAGTRQPLQVKFPAPLDHALLQRCLHVSSDAGTALPGTTTTTAGEQVWTFTPDSPWKAGTLSLQADSFLEDLAGNSLARPFEVNLQGPAPRKVPPVVSTSFLVRP